MEIRNQTPLHTQFFRRHKANLLIIFSCALFLGICITCVLTDSRKTTHREFTRMVKETLSAYTTGQRENTLTEIDGVISTLQSLAVLIEKNDAPEFIDTYLLALNEDSPEIKYTYFSYKEYQEELQAGKAPEKDIETVRRLENKEIVVSDITYSERMGGIYCVGVGVPVIIDGKLAGAVEGIINAELLVSTEVYDPAQGEISAAFLTDGNSTILPIRNKNGRGVGDRLLDRLERAGIEEEALSELQDIYESNDPGTRSVRLGTFDAAPYYMSLSSLKYNDWHFVVCLKADSAANHFEYIIRNTIYSIIVLIAAVSLAAAIILIYIRKMQKQFSADEQRYLLLEHFSDTVLFDYDCLHDTIRFTSNISKFLSVHGLVQSGFLKQLGSAYIHSDDLQIVRVMLSGHAEGKEGELKARFFRPEGEECFWCLVQYQYIYAGEILKSIIGKITDIDEQMRHEDYLVKMSQTDGLTGLLNKAATEIKSAECLKLVSAGALYIMDVDGFKQVNDKYGHAAGDLTLKFLGDCLKKTFRDTDIIGRVGGDELLVFAGGINSRNTARKKAVLLGKYLETDTTSEIPPCTVSIGIAFFPGDGETYNELFQAADQAMYAAKKKEWGRFSFYRDIGKEKPCSFSDNQSQS